MKHIFEFEGRLYESSALIVERLGISTITLYRWAKRGLLPTPIRLGRRNYFARVELEARLARGE